MSFRSFFPAFFLTLSQLLWLNANAVPLFGLVKSHSNVTASIVPDSKINRFINPARYAQIAYCSSKAVLSWSCGPPCDALPGIEPIVAGGDGGKTPKYFVAHDPNARSIVVAHQGTDSSKILSIANDVEVILESLDPTLFPGADASIKIHNGFARTFSRTAPDILGNVTAALQSTGVDKVEVHGHSLGAAIAVMDAVFLRQHLDPSITITTTVFGLPRGGNQAWADFVDQNALGLVHIHNQDDPVSTVPPRVTGFRHPSGEIHIQADQTSLDCTGQESKAEGCIDSQSVLHTSVADHIGPYYDNISMSGDDCPL